MTPTDSYTVTPIGVVRSALRRPEDAPKQGREGAPDAWLELRPDVLAGLHGLVVGQPIIVITWLHQARRDLLAVHPRDDVTQPLTGVFATRSADRPNPLGLHLVQIVEIAGSQLQVAPLEAVDGTPIIDLKPVLSNVPDG